MSKHKFVRSNSEADRLTDHPVWRSIYTEVFGTLAEGPGAIRVWPGSSQTNRDGTDKTVTLATGQEIHIDDKVRFSVYANKLDPIHFGDVAFEIYSDFKLKVEGWAAKAGYKADWVCYNILPLGVAVVIPARQFRPVWEDQIRRDRLLLHYERRESRNEGYTSLNVCIPITAISREYKRYRIVLYDPALVAGALADWRQRNPDKSRNLPSSFAIEGTREMLLAEHDRVTAERRKAIITRKAWHK